MNKFSLKNIKNMVRPYYYLIRHILSGKKNIISKYKYTTIGDGRMDCFFGYYDVSPFCSNGEKKIAYISVGDEMSEAAIHIYDIDSGQDRIIDHSNSWNWQQGCRLRWLSCEKPSLFFNDFNGKDYQILLESGTQKKDESIAELLDIFAQYADTQSKSINKIYNVVKLMQNWMRSLPEYTKKFKHYLDNGEEKTLDTGIETVRNDLLRFEINSQELIFGTWLSKLSTNENLDECFAVVKGAKELLDAHLRTYRMELNKKLTAMFMPGYQGGLSRAMIAWYKKLPEATKTHVFDADANALLTTAGTIDSYNDDDLLDTLVSIFAAIAIEDWNDNSAEGFIKNISDAIGRINEYVESKCNGQDDSRLLITIDGVQVEKTFTAEAISPLGKTAFNNLKAIFEEYNDALEPEEQLAILAKLIGEIIH